MSRGDLHPRPEGMTDLEYHVQRVRMSLQVSESKDWPAVHVRRTFLRELVDEYDRLATEVERLRLLLGVCPECNTSLVWGPGYVRCDPDCGCGWIVPLLASEGPFGEGREKALRRLADNRRLA